MTISTTEQLRSDVFVYALVYMVNSLGLSHALRSPIDWLSVYQSDAQPSMPTVACSYVLNACSYVLIACSYMLNQGCQLFAHSSNLLQLLLLFSRTNSFNLLNTPILLRTNLRQLVGFQRVDREYRVGSNHIRCLCVVTVYEIRMNKTADLEQIKQKRINRVVVSKWFLLGIISQTTLFMKQLF